MIHVKVLHKLRLKESWFFNSYYFNTCFEFMFIFWWNTWIYQNANNGITFSVSLSVLKFEFSCAQYRYHQRMSSLWEKGLQGELGDFRQGKPAQDESKIVGFAHKIFKDCCVKRGRVISDGRNSLNMYKSFVFVAILNHSSKYILLIEPENSCLLFSFTSHMYSIPAMVLFCHFKM